MLNLLRQHVRVQLRRSHRVHVLRPFDSGPHFLLQILIISFQEVDVLPEGGYFLVQLADLLPEPHYFLREELVVHE